MHKCKCNVNFLSDLPKEANLLHLLPEVLHLSSHCEAGVNGVVLLSTSPGESCKSRDHIDHTTRS